MTDLKAERVAMTTIRLTWLMQDDFKPSYSYLVVARQEDQVVYSNATSEENHTIAGLTPGASYTLEVLTVVGGVNSLVESISSQTCKSVEQSIRFIDSLQLLFNGTFLYFSSRPCSSFKHLGHRELD